MCSCCWDGFSDATHAGRPLLLADGMQPIVGDGDEGQQYRGALSAPLHTAAAPFVNLKVRVSCEALMPGKRPGMRFLVRIVNAQTLAPDPRVGGALSEAIVVTTNRAKGRGEGSALLQVKPVQKLPGVGTETARKLAQFDEWKHLLHSSAVGETGRSITSAIMQTSPIRTVRAFISPHLVVFLLNAYNTPGRLQNGASIISASQGSLCTLLGCSATTPACRWVILGGCCRS